MSGEPPDDRYEVGHAAGYHAGYMAAISESSLRKEALTHAVTIHTRGSASDSVVVLAKRYLEFLKGEQAEGERL